MNVIKLSIIIPVYFIATSAVLMALPKQSEMERQLTAYQAECREAIGVLVDATDFDMDDPVTMEFSLRSDEEAKYNNKALEALDRKYMHCIVRYKALTHRGAATKSMTEWYLADLKAHGETCSEKVVERALNSRVVPNMHKWVIRDLLADLKAQGFNNLAEKEVCRLRNRIFSKAHAAFAKDDDDIWRRKSRKTNEMIEELNTKYSSVVRNEAFVRSFNPSNDEVIKDFLADLRAQGFHYTEEEAFLLLQLTVIGAHRAFADAAAASLDVAVAAANSGPQGGE